MPQFSLMRSEIARLVYGYIDEMEGCKEVAQSFLESCPHLQEFAEGVRLGIVYNTKINNKSLLDYLRNSSNNENASPNQCCHQDMSGLLTKLANNLNELSGKQIPRGAPEQSSQNVDKKLDEFAKMLNSMQLQIHEMTKIVQNNFESFRQSQSHKCPSSNGDPMKTPKSNRKYGGQNPFLSPAAHSSMINSPRRKNYTPRRLYTPHPHHHLHGRVYTPDSSRVPSSPATTAHYSQYSPYTTDPPSQFSNMTSSPMVTDSSELDIQALIDKPTIVNKFIEMSTNSESLPNKIANAINQGINYIGEGGNTADNIIYSLFGNNTELPPPQSSHLQKPQQQQQQPSEPSNSNNMELQSDIHYAPQQMQDLLTAATNALNDDSEYNYLVNSIILSTPFKQFDALTPSSVATSNGSLNTPNIFTDMDGNSANKENGGINSELFPVKNLLKDLNTPEKSSRANFDNEQSSNSHSVREALGESSNNISRNESDNSLNQTVIEVSQQNCSKQGVSSSSAQSTSNDSILALSQSKSPLNRSSSELNVSGKNDKNRAEFNNNSSGRHNTPKPIFLNTHLQSKRGFSRLKNDQNAIKKSINYKESLNDNFLRSSTTANHTTQSNSSQQEVLTTTIAKVNESTKTTDSNTANQVTALNLTHLDSNSIQINNSQIQVINQPTAVTTTQQQPGQLFYTAPPGTTIWDPATGVATAANQSLILIPSPVGNGYNFANITPQITTTNQHSYYRIVSTNEQSGTLQHVLAAPTNSPSMPTISGLTNSDNGSALADKGNSGDTSISLEKSTPQRDSSSKTNKNRPAILSGKKKQNMTTENNQQHTAPTANISITSNEGSQLKSRKEPRKSELGKRSIADDVEPPLYRPPVPIAPKRKHSNSLINESSKKISRQSEDSNSNGVSTLLNSNLESFLQSVHNTAERKSNSTEKSSKRNSSGSEKSTTSRKDNKEASSKRSGKGKGK